MIRTVVFDVDDTLYLERNYVRSGFHAVDDWLNGRTHAKGFADQAWALFESGCRGDIFNRALAASGVEHDAALVGAMVEQYRLHVPQISLAADAVAVLGRLAHRYRCAAITDGPVDSQRAKVKALGLERWLSPIVVTGELGPGKGKPALDAFVLVETATGAAGKECVYIADNPAKDFAGPRQLGWSTVRIRRPEGLHAHVACVDSDHEMTDFDRLEKVLESL